MLCVSLAGTMCLSVRRTGPGQTSHVVSSTTLAWRSRSRVPVPASLATARRGSSTPHASLTVALGQISTPSAHRTGPGLHTRPVLVTCGRPRTGVTGALDLAGARGTEQQRPSSTVTPSVTEEYPRLLVTMVEEGRQSHPLLGILTLVASALRRPPRLRTGAVSGDLTRVEPHLGTNQAETARTSRQISTKGINRGSFLNKSNQDNNPDNNQDNNLDKSNLDNSKPSKQAASLANP